MSERECSQDDCTGKVVARGLCGKHDARLKRSQEDAPRCAAQDCDRPQYAGGLCTMHYDRQRNTGTTADPREMCRAKLHEMTSENTITFKNGKRCRACLDEWKATHVPGTCSIEGCDDPVLARGWCTKHYRAWDAHGDPLGRRLRTGTCPESAGCPFLAGKGSTRSRTPGRVWSVRLC